MVYVWIKSIPTHANVKKITLERIVKPVSSLSCAGGNSSTVSSLLIDSAIAIFHGSFVLLFFQESMNVTRCHVLMVESVWIWEISNMAITIINVSVSQDLLERIVKQISMNVIPRHV